MTKRPYRQLAVAAAGLFCFVHVASADPSLTEARQQRIVLVEKLAKQDQDLRGISAELDPLSEKIQRIKTKKPQNRSFVQEYRLQSLLQKAQQLSLQLQQLTSAKNDTIAALKKAQQELSARLDTRIDRSFQIANAKSESWDRRRQAALELETLTAEKMRLSLGAGADQLPPTTSGLLEKPAPDEIRDRLDAMRDFDRRLQREVALIETEISEMRRQNFVRKELGHFMDEEAFFDEQGFVRGGVTRKDKGSTVTDLSKAGVTVAGKKEETAGTKEPVTSSAPTPGTDSSSSTGSKNTEPTAPTSPSSPAESVDSSTTAPKMDAPASDSAASGSPDKGVDATNLSAPVTKGEFFGTATEKGPEESLNGSLQIQNSARLDTAAGDNLRPSLPESRERDPLAQLASEFGLPIPEAARTSGERANYEGSSRDQLRWLAQRLATTRQMLNLLRERTRVLERRLPAR
ncbi:MAG TPA: hypothetical protein VI895_14325 [Bdellovibrionota bacterium]|nr:hypothetical protein [Bdellovibrionota bacterium]